MNTIYSTLAAMFIHIAMFFESVSFWFHERVKIEPPFMNMDEAQKELNNQILAINAQLERQINNHSIN